MFRLLFPTVEYEKNNKGDNATARAAIPAILKKARIITGYEKREAYSFIVKPCCLPYSLSLVCQLEMPFSSVTDLSV